MNLFRALIVLLLLASPAFAGKWRWIRSHGNYYVWSDGYTNDGHYYTQDAGKYYRVQSTVQAPVDWKTKLVSALDRQRENDYFLQAIRESGLTPDLQQASATTQNAYSTSTVVTQQGVGYHGLQAYAPNIGSVDIESLIAKNARTIERMIDGTGQANAALSDRIGQVIEGQNEALKINAAGAALVASIQATQQPRVTTQTTETVAGSSPVVRTQVQAQHVESATINRVRTEALLNQKCGKCHVADSKGDFVLRELDANTFDRVWQAVHSQKNPMPPRDSGIAPLTPAEILILSRSSP